MTVRSSSGGSSESKVKYGMKETMLKVITFPVSDLIKHPLSDYDGATYDNAVPTKLKYRNFKLPVLSLSSMSELSSPDTLIQSHRREGLLSLV